MLWFGQRDVGHVCEIGMKESVDLNQPTKVCKRTEGKDVLPHGGWQPCAGSQARWDGRGPPVCVCVQLALLLCDGRSVFCLALGWRCRCVCITGIQPAVRLVEVDRGRYARLARRHGALPWPAKARARAKLTGAPPTMRSGLHSCVDGRRGRCRAGLQPGAGRAHGGSRCSGAAVQRARRSGRRGARRPGGLRALGESRRESRRLRREVLWAAAAVLGDVHVVAVRSPRALAAYQQVRHRWSWAGSWAGAWSPAAQPSPPRPLSAE